MTPIYDLRKRLELYFFGILLIATLLYGAWRIFPLIAGPRIIITTPKNNEMVSSTTFAISGNVSRVKNIEISGRAIPIDKDGNFSEILVTQFPYTVITLKATDFYDKTITKTLQVIPK